VEALLQSTAKWLQRRHFALRAKADLIVRLHNVAIESEAG
jgi:hypothetical protein